MRKKWIIAFDCDDVLTDFVGAWRRYLNLKYGLDVQSEDIKSWDIEKFFPGVFESINTQDDKTKVYLVLNGPTAAGVMLAEKHDSTLDVKLDYTTPAYRDTSVGKFLYDYLAKNEIKQLCVKTQVPEHGIYLKKMGFEENAGLYQKTL